MGHRLLKPGGPTGFEGAIGHRFNDTLQSIRVLTNIIKLYLTYILAPKREQKIKEMLSMRAPKARAIFFYKEIIKITNKYHDKIP